MKFLIFVFLLSPLSLIAAPSCDDLKAMLRNYEKAIQGKNLGNTCSDVDAKEMWSASDPKSEGKPADASESQVKLLNQYKCQDLSVIELRLKTVESELTLHSGIMKLKNEVAAQKDKTKASGSPEAAKDFKENLSAAQTIELLAHTQVDKDRSFLYELNTINPEFRDTLDEFKAIVKKFCNDPDRISEEKAIDVCSEHFEPNQLAVDEVNGLLNAGKSSDGKFKQKQVEELRKTLLIKKKTGEAYNYTSLRSDLKESLKSESSLSKNEVKAVQNLPDFENSSNLGFLSKLNGSKGELQNRAVKERFRFLLEDLEKRQAWELNNQYSLIKLDFGKYMTGDIEKACQGDLKSECLHALKKSPDVFGGDKAHIAKMAEEFERTEHYMDQITKSQELCLTGAVVPAECEKKVSDDQARLLEDLYALQVLKNKILEDSQELMTFRNYAAEKLVSTPKCVSTEVSQVGDCYEDLDRFVSKDVTILAGNGLGISTSLLKNPQTEKDIAALCSKEPTQVIYKRELLCSARTEKTPDEKKVDSEAKKLEEYKKLIKEQDKAGSGMGKAIGASADNMLMNMANLFGQRNMYQNYVNPYPSYNFSNYGGSGLGIADSILMPNRYLGGYGFYTGTPGLPNYSSFGSYSTTYPQTPQV